MATGTNAANSHIPCVSVVKVLRPVNVSSLNDDYQDVRVLRQTDEFVELEVVHYPLNTVGKSITGRRDWISPPEELQPWLKAGLTTNWDPQFRKDLLDVVQKEGFDVSEKTDAEVVRHVARWLLKRGTFRDVFGTYFVDFSDGQPRIMSGLEQAFKDYNGGVNARLPLKEHLDRELFGKGMFYNRCYGTCTSTATYLATLLCALGIPTRMVLAIPIVDANDAGQLQLVERGISNHARQAAPAELASAIGFSAHTFNEVYVDGRWRRLNYNQLGANIDSTFGLMTHIHTFGDLSEAGLTSTWGWRYGKGERNTIFKTSNPYCATEVSDRFGIHCGLSNPEVEEKEHTGITITKAYWPGGPGGRMASKAADRARTDQGSSSFTVRSGSKGSTTRSTKSSWGGPTPISSSSLKTCLRSKGACRACTLRPRPPSCVSSRSNSTARNLRNCATERPTASCR